MAENSNTAVEQSRRCEQMIAKAWMDPSFKERLLAEPAAVAREQGLDIPDDVPLRAIEIAPDETYVVLTAPEQPSGAAVEEQEPWMALLERAASDPAYKARLIAEPVAVLAEQGIELPAEARVRVVEPSDTEGYLFVPPVPEGLDIETLNEDDTTGYGTSITCFNTWITHYSVQSLSAQPRVISSFGSPIALQRAYL